MIDYIINTTNPNITKRFTNFDRCLNHSWFLNLKIKHLSYNKGVLPSIETIVEVSENKISCLTLKS